jgi:hypothetical protein
MFIRSCTLIHFLGALTKRRLSSLTVESSLINHRYARIVGRIFENPNLVQRRTAQKLLGWITFSKRPMKWHEIQGATSINTQQRIVDFEGRQMPDHVRDICGSLVEVLPGDLVQLVHKTARE